MTLTAARRSAGKPMVPGSDRVRLWTLDVARVRRIGLVLLGLQLVGLCVWSAVLVDRYALTLDFVIYHQAFWLIGHGHLDPFDSVQGFPYWQGHGEFLMWPLALIGAVWPHPVTQLWIQDLAVVGAEMVGFVWLCEIAERVAESRPGSRWPVVLPGLGVLLFVLDPWIFWSVSFDFHFEPVGAVFLLLAGRELWRHPRSRRVWIWVALALACGDVVTTYVLGVGAGAVLAGRQWRRRGLEITALAGVWALFVSSVLGAHKAAGYGSGYGYLVAGGAAVQSAAGLPQLAKGIVTHLGTVISVLWSKRVDLYAAIGVGGLLGALWPWVTVPVALVLLENGLKGSGLLFISPSFQDVLAYVLVPVGTIAVLAAIGRRYSWVAVGLSVVIGLNAVGWAAVWLPRSVDQWLRVSPEAAATLASVAARIPTGDEVIASQGVAGGFSQRRWVYGVGDPGVLPVNTRSVWTVIAPLQGTEQAPVIVEQAWVAEMAGPLRAQLVVHDHGIWVFHWHPSAHTVSLTIPATVSEVPAWTALGGAGTLIPVGPSAGWRAEANGKRGYVVEGDYWNVGVGRFQANIEMSAQVPTAVEVWNATTNTLMERRDVPATSGTITVTMPVDLEKLEPSSVFAGSGPFHILPVPPAPGNPLELRVWTPGGGPVSVTSLQLVRASARTS